jgi:hypothetical protein
VPNSQVREIGLEITDTLDTGEVRTVRARYIAPIGYGSTRIVVDECPYCGHTHRHMWSPDVPMRRLADCERGEYVLVFNDIRGEESSDR